MDENDSRDPAYNEEEALLKTLDEYLAYVDEIVIVNDGSKDNTDKIAQDYSELHEKIHHIKHEANKGKPEALRIGVKNLLGTLSYSPTQTVHIRKVHTRIR